MWGIYLALQISKHFYIYFPCSSQQLLLYVLLLVKTTQGQSPHIQVLYHLQLDLSASLEL